MNFRSCVRLGAKGWVRIAVCVWTFSIWNMKSREMFNHSSLCKRALALCEECTQRDAIIKLTLRTAVYNHSSCGSSCSSCLARKMSRLFDTRNMAGSFGCLPRLVTTWAFKAAVLWYSAVVLFWGLAGLSQTCLDSFVSANLCF